MQGAGKILQRSIWLICKQEIFSRNTAVGMKSKFLEVPLSDIRPIRIHLALDFID
jgi:hypothetical protein